MTTSSCWVRDYISTPSPTVQSTPVKRTVERDTGHVERDTGHVERESSPWPRKEFDCNGDVATRVDMRTTKVKCFKKYLSEGMSEPGKSNRPEK